MPLRLRERFQHCLVALRAAKLLADIRLGGNSNLMSIICYVSRTLVIVRKKRGRDFFAQFLARPCRKACMPNSSSCEDKAPLCPAYLVDPSMVRARMPAGPITVGALRCTTLPPPGPLTLSCCPLHPPPTPTCFCLCLPGTSTLTCTTAYHIPCSVCSRPLCSGSHLSTSSCPGSHSPTSFLEF